MWMNPISGKNIIFSVVWISANRYWCTESQIVKSSRTVNTINNDNYDDHNYNNDNANPYHVSNAWTRQPVETDSQGVPVLDNLNDNINSDDNEKESSHSGLDRPILREQQYRRRRRGRRWGCWRWCQWWSWRRRRRWRPALPPYFTLTSEKNFKQISYKGGF